MKKRTLIVGRGAAGQTLADDIKRHGGEVIGFLDDHVAHESVLGRLSDVDNIVRAHSIDLVYFAIPSVDAKTVRDFINSIESDTVELAIVPRTYSTITKETVDIGDLTDVDVLDLVGRRPVKHDLQSARDFISGKKVLVTGAAGSIGSRLMKQLSGMHALSLVGVDWWENGMFNLRRDLPTLENVTLRVGDVKNVDLMRGLFTEHAPDIVFHAAAYKHVPLMQSNPLEAFNNNVGSSLNLMHLAVEHSVKNFVYVSTDKAVNPVNVMGTTKRIGEMLMESFASRSRSTKFNAVRFGNVIESNGSVMQIFREQIAKKKPVTVTDADVTRYFMTIDEASQLIIQSAMLGRNGEIFVLDMGEPVKIIDLAKSLVRATSPGLPIEIVGLRPGEKLYEELTYDPAKVDTTTHSSIFVARDEQPFDVDRFSSDMERLLAESSQYRISGGDLIHSLRDLGFAIK